MAKKSTVFFCKECGFESAKWMGQCPGCKEWNTFVEEPVEKKTGSSSKSSIRLHDVKPMKLNEISLAQEERISTGMEELDRVLGGGIVPGSLVLVGGDPGIGKSTLLLQVCRNLAADQRDVIYISGEESLQQIKMRASRMGEFTGNLSLVSETNLDLIDEVIEAQKPQVVIIDSIQTMYRDDVSSAPGSVSQVREATAVLMQIAKQKTISIFLVGHVTKEGMVAGPRVLEHMVDTVLYFEGDRYASYRMIRGVKNRFGATNEVGVFEMKQNGLNEVKNPSAFLLSGRPENAGGSAIGCTMEGTRPMLLEIQSLVCKTNFGLPRRTSVGIDYNRVNLLIAVLEKKAGLNLGECDVYVNITGGIRVNEPAMDLAIILSLISSYYDTALDSSLCAFGEVGLTGEVRGVTQVSSRVKEAVKLGYEQCMLSKTSYDHLEKGLKANCIPVSTVKDVISYIRKK